MNRLAAVFLAMSLPAQACPGLAVENGWVRAAPQGAMMTAAYAKLVNRGTQPLVIDGAFAADFAAAELHRTVVESGMYKMREDALTLAPGATAELAPGSWHLMLMRPARALKAQDRVAVGLKCGRQAREFSFTVKADE